MLDNPFRIGDTVIVREQPQESLYKHGGIVVEHGQIVTLVYADGYFESIKTAKLRLLERDDITLVGVNLFVNPNKVV